MPMCVGEMYSLCVSRYMYMYAGGVYRHVHACAQVCGFIFIYTVHYIKMV